MERPKLSLRTFFLSVLLGIFLLAYVGEVFRPAPPAPPGNELRAFLNTKWGMSVAEVEEAAHSRLTPSASNKFYSGPSGAEKRSKTWESRGQKFLGRRAVVDYAFLNDRFYSYHVFTSDGNSDTLDADMRKFLIRVFGPRYSLVEDETPLKMIWHFPDKIVNYWFYEEDLALAEKYRAGYGVVYRPIEEAA